jgi:hypothetical protein
VALLEGREWRQVRPDRAAIVAVCVILTLGLSREAWREPVPDTLFLFPGVFPLINGIFDALSHAVTLRRLGLR